MMDMVLVRQTEACKVLACVDIGSDHRPVLLELSCEAPKKRRRKKHCSKRWRPDSDFTKKVGDCLAGTDPIYTVAGKAASIHHALLTSLPDTVSHPGGDGLPQLTPADVAIHDLIQRRRALTTMADLSPQQRKQQRVAMGKDIQNIYVHPTSNEAHMYMQI